MTTTAPADPGAASGSPVPVTAGKVEVRLGKSTYRSGEAVTATVVNGFDRAIYTEDFKTACTIVVLQRMQGDSWTDVTGCALGRPTLTVTIGPGLGQPVTIDANSFHLRDNPIRQGTYRIKFGYGLDRDHFGDEQTVVYSSQLIVQ
jgi:hypothetical protein